jgi:hypothetical protein
VKNATKTIFKNNQSNPTGGFYPMGFRPNLRWYPCGLFFKKEVIKVGVYDACIKCGTDKKTEHVRLGSHKLMLCPACSQELRDELNGVIIKWVKKKKPEYYKRRNIPEPEEPEEKKGKFSLLNLN